MLNKFVSSETPDKADNIRLNAKELPDNNLIQIRMQHQKSKIIITLTPILIPFANNDKTWTFGSNISLSSSLACSIKIPAFFLLFRTKGIKS